MKVGGVGGVCGEAGRDSVDLGGSYHWDPGHQWCNLLQSILRHHQVSGSLSSVPTPNVSRVA